VPSVFISFNIGNGYELDNDTISVYLDAVEFREEDWWIGLSRKFQHGIVLFQQTETAQDFTIPRGRLKRLNETFVADSTWADITKNTGASEPGPIVTLPRDDSYWGASLFLYGSPTNPPHKPVAHVMDW